VASALFVRQLVSPSMRLPGEAREPALLPLPAVCILLLCLSTTGSTWLRTALLLLTGNAGSISVWPCFRWVLFARIAVAVDPHGDPWRKH
jgi:hypothetical protein